MRGRRPRIIIWGMPVLLAIAIGGRPAAGARIVLARQGEPRATIVIPANASERERLAAAELQHYVRAICGVTLPLRTDGKAVDGTGLYIGRCELTRETDIPDKCLNPETYALHVRDGNIFFTGRYPTPTYFAVVSFLEDVLGVRWFAPGDEWEYVPRGKPGELVVDVEDIVKVPETSPRIWSGHRWNDDWKAWCWRNKAVLSEVVPRLNFQNYLFRVFPPSRYAKEHPEYFPLVGGQRWIPSSDEEAHWRPCESNPEVQRILIDYIRRWFDARPETDSFSLGMDDIAYLCGCPNCRAWDPHPDSYEKRQFSDRHYKFVNLIAREIAKTHPDRYIGTLIYSIARPLPETVARLEPNVFGYLTEVSALWWEPGRKAADQQLTREWAKRCRHLSRYDYYGLGCITPRVYPHTMAAQIKFDKSLGLEGMYIECYTFLPNTAPMMWACAKLQWDSRRDIDRLLNEFYTKMFGAAARTIRRYYALLERSYNTPREGRGGGGWEHRNLRIQALAMAPEDVEAGFRLLTQAEREAKTAREHERIACLRAALQYGSYPIKEYAMARALAREPVKDIAAAQAVLQKVVALGHLAREREAFWAAALERDDLVGETVRGLSGMGYLVTAQIADLEQGAVVAALKALATIEEKAPDKLAPIQEELMRALPETGFGGALQAWVRIRRTQQPNLLRNGDFETAGENQEPAQGDWQTAGAPVGWSFWTSTGGTVQRVPGKGRNGSAAGSITGVTSGTFLQTLPVQPGERYLVISWARSEPEGSNSGAVLAVRFQRPDGRWHERRDLEPTTGVCPEASGWQPLMLIVTVPEGAGRLVVMPGARRQASGTTALHDDVAVYRLD